MRIDCNEIHKEILDEVKNSSKEKKILYIISVGNDLASESYIKGKKKDCKYCDINVIHTHYNVASDETFVQTNLKNKIMAANNNVAIGGILLQLPLPKGWDEEYFTNLISPEKDVDGFVQNSKFSPCTPEGIMYLIKRKYGDDLSGKTVLLIGRGKLVGKPLLKMLIDANATVTICHSKTTDIDNYINNIPHDIIITGVGKKIFDVYEANTDFIIDAGITYENGKIGGDCYNFNDYAYNYVTTPGGVGLITRAMLMKHMVSVL